MQVESRADRRPTGKPLAGSAAVHPITGSAPAILVLAFLASMLGIVSRPELQLATFWPTNALLLGLLIRNPGLARRPLVWLAAVAGYVAADLATGASLTKTTSLTLANIAGVAAGVLLARSLALREQTFSRPADMLWLLLVCGFASLWGGLVGTVAGGNLLRMDVLQGFGFWFSAELVSYLALVPAVLLAPPPRRAPQAFQRTWGRLRRRPANLLPLLTLALSVLVATWMGGPGALMLPVPALLWCALTYRMFTTAVITMGMCVWALVSIATGLLPLHEGGMTAHDAISLRIGVALMAVAPLTVAAVSAARHRLLLDLDHAASHDSLTGLLGRGAFLARAGALLPALSDGHRPVSLMMLDVDHFKQINDRHGHAAGDRVLTALARHMRATLRPGDLIGRIGGEEFAILLADIPPADAARIGERLLLRAAGQPVEVDDDVQATVTASIGCASYARGDAPLRLDDMFRVADSALYAAKAAGRNRLVQTRVD